MPVLSGRPRVAILLGLMVGLSATREGRANGRFPNANGIRFEPDDPHHFVVQTTFGLLESYDGGTSFSWTCEAPLGLADQEDPMLAITEAGVRVVGTFAGVVTSEDGCNWSRSPSLTDQIIPDLALDRARPGHLLAFSVAGLPQARFSSQVVESSDDGRTWTPLGEPLDQGVLPLSLDVAPSDPSRVYLTVRLGSESAYASELFVSDDGGVSFEAKAIPGTEDQSLAFIAAVAPADSDIVYFRIADPDGSLLLLSRDAGETFSTLLTATGRLLGFALSPDGQELAVGGPDDGVWAGAADGSDLTRRSDLAVSCLAWNGPWLYACEGEFGGLSRARSSEPGSFQSLLEFSDLCGSTCDESSDIGSVCPAYWEVVAPQLDATCGTQQTGSADPPPVRAVGGCAHAPIPNPGPEPWGLIAGLGIAVGFFRRRLSGSA